MGVSFLLDVTQSNGIRTNLEVDDPSTLTIADVKQTLSNTMNGTPPAYEITLTDRSGTVLLDDRTIEEAHLDSLNNRIRMDAPSLRKHTRASTTAEFVGYLILSLVLLVLLFVFISFSESAYDAVEQVYTRMSRRQWREGRPSVLVELMVFFGVLVFFGIMMWQLAVHGSSSDAANKYGSNPSYPNPTDPQHPEHTNVPKERKKKMTTKERVLAVVGTLVLVLLIALIAYAFQSTWVQGKIQGMRDHIGNRRNRE